MLTPQTIGIAFLAGFLPTIVWLWFWLQQDRNKEPVKRIIFCFIAGGVMVAATLFFQALLGKIVTGEKLIVGWAIIEEILKFSAAYIIALRLAVTDEPIDAPIYLITVALGFAAVENVLFLLKPLIDGDVIQTIVTGNVRFVGATLIHILSSGIVGVALALVFFKKTIVRWTSIIIGLILAIALHSAFNLFIISIQQYHAALFVGVWIATIGLMLVLEYIKRIRIEKITIIH